MTPSLQWKNYFRFRRSSAVHGSMKVGIVHVWHGGNRNTDNIYDSKEAVLINIEPQQKLLYQVVQACAYEFSPAWRVYSWSMLYNQLNVMRTSLPVTLTLFNTSYYSKEPYYPVTLSHSLKTSHALKPGMHVFARNVYTDSYY